MATSKRSSTGTFIKRPNPLWKAAEVLAIGPYSLGLVDCLHLAPRFYRTMRTGEWVTTFLFRCANDKQSRGLASAVGVIREDPSTHHFDPSRVNEQWLQATFPEPFDSSWPSFVGLRDAGFLFFYVPGE